MEVKTIEIRDRGTFIPALAIDLRCRDNKDYFLLRRAGFAEMQILSGVVPEERYIVLMSLISMECNYDPYGWKNPRTMANAHQFLIDHWEEVANGSVVDVEFLLGETKEPKRSEALGETNIVRTLEESDRIIP